MMDKAGGVQDQTVRPGKYARVERERRFLLAEAPTPSAATVTRMITDRYLVGTRLRLRRAEWSDGRCELKLTQKVPVARPAAVQGLITNTYLSSAEYDLLASLPAAALSKTRFSVPPLGVDVFDGPLQGLVLAEAEFTTDEEALSFMPPPECVAEVTDDARFTGGRLVETSRPDLLQWLAKYGIHPGASLAVEASRAVLSVRSASMPTVSGHVAQAAPESAHSVLPSWGRIAT